MSLLVDIEKELSGFTLRVSFAAKNEVMALLGASGSGKSMTLRCIAGIESPTRGRIVLDDIILYDSERRINLPAKQRRVGYLFQNYALFPHMTAAENIAVGMRTRDKSQRAQAVAQWIERFYLQGLEQRLPSQMSGGQQQRVALARMLASEPQILLLDEPFSAMDTWLRWQLEQDLSDALEQFSGTTIFVSHNRNEVYRLCSRVGVMDSGSFGQLSEKRDLFSSPETVEACLLTGCKNISSALAMQDGTVYVHDWGIYLRGQKSADASVGHVGIRAHYFRATSQTQGENIFPITVCQVIEDTFSVIVMVRPQAATKSGRNSLIRWEISKEVWRNLEGTIFALSVAAEDILLLS